jgi:hypothetical protein
MYTTAEQACNAGFSEQTGLSFDWTDRITICKSAISLAEQSRALTEHYPDTHKSETGRSSAELSAQITVIEERIATMHGRQSAAERAELAADQERRRIAEEQARQELAARQDQQRADEEQKRLADAAAVAAARRYETGAQLLGLAVKVVPSIENPSGYNLRGVTTCRIGLKKGSAPNDTEYSAYYAILYEVDIANAFGVSGRYFYPIEVIAPFKLSIPDVSYEFPKDLAAWFKTVGMRTSQKWILPGKVGILRGSMTGTSVTVVGDMSDSTQRYATRPSSTWCTDTLNWGVAFQTI